MNLRAEDGSVRRLPADDPMRWPQFLPGSNHFIYVAFDSAAHSYRAMASDYVVRKPVSLMETGSRVHYAPPRHAGEPGYLLFMRGANLIAQRFDSDRLRLAGEAFPIAQNVIYYGPTLATSFSVSANGVLVYQAGFPTSELKWYDRGGKVVGTAGEPAAYWGNVRVSPDGRRVAATVWSPETGGACIWILDIRGRESRRLTFPPDVHRRPVWSPDGARVAFGGSRNVGRGPHLAILDLATNSSTGDFANEQDQDIANTSALPTDWSRDGRFIAFDDGAPHEVQRSLIGDGAWLVRWRADGRELFYLGLDNQLYAVPVKGKLEPGDPRPLFRIAGPPQYNTTRDFQFDVSPDGQRFVMPTTGSAPPPPFTVVENWQDKFRR